ncbi:MAG: hypothetical protein ACYC6L_05615 [Anaerolineae bacterium]
MPIGDDRWDSFGRGQSRGAAQAGRREAVGDESTRERPVPRLRAVELAGLLGWEVPAARRARHRDENRDDNASHCPPRPSSR